MKLRTFLSFFFLLNVTMNTVLAGQYSAKLIDTGNCGRATALNNLGQVVGNGCFDSGGGNNPLNYAFITGQNGNGIRNIYFQKDYAGFATGINDLGQMVGYSHHSFGMYALETSSSFVASYNGGFSTLPQVVPDFHTFALDINNNGKLAMVRNNGLLKETMVMNLDGSGVELLGILGDGTPGYNYSIPTAINSSGYVVGYSRVNTTGADTAFISRGNNTGITVLNNDFSRAFDINDSGVTVGYGNFSQGITAFISSPNGGEIRPLLTRYGYSVSTEAHGINNLGQVVGNYGIGDISNGTAFVTGENGINPVDINSLVINGNFNFSEAIDINDSGQILAIANGHSYLLSPVPEPETIFYLAIGLILLTTHKKIRRI